MLLHPYFEDLSPHLRLMRRQEDRSDRSDSTMFVMHVSISVTHGKSNEFVGWCLLNRGSNVKWVDIRGNFCIFPIFVLEVIKIIRMFLVRV